MTRRARHLLPDLPQRTERAGRVASRAAAADHVLALQRQAGNRAVCALLARTPKGAPAPAKPAAPEAPKVHHVIVPEVGTIPLLSFQWGVGGAGQPAPKELVLSTEVGDHSTALARAAASGTPLGLVEIVLMKDGKEYGRIKLHAAMISSYSMSGTGGKHGKPTEMWTLNAQSIEFDFPGAKGPGGGGDGGGGGGGGSRDQWHLDG